MAKKLDSSKPKTVAPEATLSKQHLAAAAAKKSRRLMIGLVSGLVVVSVSAIAGTVWYGAVLQPQLNHQKDVTACSTFNDGLLSAHAQTSYEGYFNEIFMAANDAALQADKKGPVYSTLIQLAGLRLQISAESGSTGVQLAEQGATLIQMKCASVLQVKAPSSNATASSTN
jgi:hypothetical protein